MSSLAHLPQVVGTISPQGLAALAQSPLADRLVDIVEARFDLAIAAASGAGTTSLPDLSPFFPSCARLEETGSPVLATIRLTADGGRWPDDRGRLPWFDEVLSRGAVSWVDIEIESAVAAEVVALARARGRKVIVSHHDFSGTPDAAGLQAAVDRAAALGADVVKIATTVADLDDHHRLIELLKRHRSPPATAALALIGMGPLGTPLRSYLPCIGSRLTYGYLDAGVAPGQLQARDLVQRLVADCPAYAAWRQRQGRL